MKIQLLIVRPCRHLRPCAGSSIGIDTSRVKLDAAKLTCWPRDADTQKTRDHPSDFRHRRAARRCSKGCSAPTTPWCWPCSCSACPKTQQRKALRYGIIGAFAFRALATLLAVYLIQLGWVKLARGRVSAVSVRTTTSCTRRDGERAARRPKRKPMLGIGAFWATVVKVELTDIVFAIDSILVAVAMSPKLWVMLTGGILGIIDDAPGDRHSCWRSSSAIRRSSTARSSSSRGWASSCWSSILHTEGYIGFEIPKWLSLGLIVVIFALSWWLARRQEARTRTDTEDAAAQLLSEEEISQ